MDSLGSEPLENGASLGLPCSHGVDQAGAHRRKRDFVEVIVNFFQDRARLCQSAFAGVGAREQVVEQEVGGVEFHGFLAFADAVIVLAREIERCGAGGADHD